MLWYANCLDSRLRGNDGRLGEIVIPAKAGIQESMPELIEKLRKIIVTIQPQIHPSTIIWPTGQAQMNADRFKYKKTTDIVLKSRLLGRSGNGPYNPLSPCRACSEQAKLQRQIVGWVEERHEVKPALNPRTIFKHISASSVSSVVKKYH